MSTDYDVWCVDCATGLGLDENHGYLGPRICAELIERRDRIAAMADGFDAIIVAMPSTCAGGAELKIDFRLRVDPRWFRKHAGHALRVRDEYGAFDGDCRKRPCCPTCGSSFDCRLPLDHVGPCWFEKIGGGQVEA